ncbi:MAG: hypothetical protein V4857_23475 [Pseudomonadota bacterium]
MTDLEEGLAGLLAAADLDAAQYDFEAAWAIDFTYHSEADDVLDYFVRTLASRYDDNLLKVESKGRKIQISYEGSLATHKVRNDFKECFRTLGELNLLLGHRYQIRAMSYRKDEGRFMSFVIARKDEWAVIDGTAQSGLFYGITPDKDFGPAKMPQLLAKPLMGLGAILIPFLIGLLVRALMWGRNRA